MFRQQSWAIAVVAFGLTLISGKLAVSQPSPPPLSARDEIFKLVLSTTGLSAVPSTQSDYFQQVSHGIILPDYLTSNQPFLGTFKEFDRIPTGSGDGKYEDGDSMPERLLKAGSVIEFSAQSFTDDEKSELRAAQSVVYSNFLRLTPSDAYISYSKYKADYDQTTSQLAGASTQQRSSILTKIRQIERDWTLFGHRSDIDAALSILQKYQASNAPNLSTSWLSSLPEGAAASATALSDAFQRTDWVRLTKTDNEIKRGGVLSIGQSNVEIPPLNRLSFEFQIVRLNRPALQNPFLDDRTWRLKGGQFISGGPVPNAALIPRYISSLMLVRNVEMVFDSDVKQSAFAGASSASTIIVSNFNVRVGGQGCLVYQPKYLLSCSVSVLGFIVSHLPTIPNPDPDRVWKTN